MIRRKWLKRLPKRWRRRPFGLVLSDVKINEDKGRFQKVSNMFSEWKHCLSDVMKPSKHYKNYKLIISLLPFLLPFPSFILYSVLFILFIKKKRNKFSALFPSIILFRSFLLGLGRKSLLRPCLQPLGSSDLLRKALTLELLAMNLLRLLMSWTSCSRSSWFSQVSYFLHASDVIQMLFRYYSYYSYVTTRQSLKKRSTNWKLQLLVALVETLPSWRGLGQFGDVASNILKSEGSGAGVASAEVADQAAGALGNALDAPRSNWHTLIPATWYRALTHLSLVYAKTLPLARGLRIPLSTWTAEYSGSQLTKVAGFNLGWKNLKDLNVPPECTTMEFQWTSWYDTAPRCPMGATRTKAATEGWSRWCQEHLGHTVYGDHMGHQNFLHSFHPFILDTNIFKMYFT